MSKEEIKEDIINDINRLLSKDSGNVENVNEMFNNMPEVQPTKQAPQAPQQPQQQMPPQQMPPQMPPQMRPQQQMPPQHLMQQMPPQHLMQQRQMQQQMPQIQLTPQQMQQMQQLSPQQQQQYYQQLVSQHMGLQQQQQQQQMLAQTHESFTGSIDYNALIYGNRETLVLLLLYIILITPQINNVMNTIPYTSDNKFYPNYLGILVRGLLFIGIYLGMKNFKLI